VASQNGRLIHTACTVGVAADASVAAAGPWKSLFLDTTAGTHIYNKENWTNNLWPNWNRRSCQICLFPADLLPG
jgi:hypothetical protein